MPLIPDQNEHLWSLAEMDFDGMPLFVRINESARSIVGHADLGIKLGFAMPMQAAIGTDLPDPEENEALAELEDKIIETVTYGAEGIHVLTLTNAAMKELVFYIKPGADIAAMHESLRGLDISHDVQCQAVWDREWNTFLQFLPDRDGG
ncbi:MAG: DUF695 domain-containing protein [Planctomycetaceae bacterium]|nr:DUF695 domain-containing protein [Planctomycetaceae bacterium]